MSLTGGTNVTNVSITRATSFGERERGGGGVGERESGGPKLSRIETEAVCLSAKHF